MSEIEKTALAGHPKSMWQKALIASIITLCVNALIAIVIVLIGNYSTTEWRILGTSAIIFAFCLGMLGCVHYYQQQKEQAEKYKRNNETELLVYLVAGIVVCAVFSVLFILMVWNVIRPDFWSLCLTFTVVFMGSMHAVLILAQNSSDKRIRMIKIATLVLAALAAIPTFVLIWYGYYGDIVLRIHLAILILLLLGTVLVPILIHVFKIAVIEESPKPTTPEVHAKDTPSVE